MNTKMQQCIADNLRYLRNYYDYTQADIARLLHISPSSYRMIENGARPARTDVLVKLAQIYQVSMNLLFEEDPAFFAREVALSQCPDITYLIHLYRRLSPFSQGRLLETGSLLLLEEKITKNQR